MVWRIRHHEREDEAPDYGPASTTEFFTIKMHHAGKFFKNLGFPCYLGNKNSLIDFCHPDEMSLIELKNMISEIGVDNVVTMFCSQSGVDKCNDLIPIVTDFDAMNLASYADENRMVGVFIEHSPDESGGNGQVSNSEWAQYVLDPDPNTENDSLDHAVKSEMKDAECEDGWTGYTEAFQNSDWVDKSETEGSDDAQSIGSDEKLSEKMGESEFEVSDDDHLFEEFVDADVEWGDLSVPEPVDDQPCSSRTRSQNKGKAKVRTGPRRVLFDNPEFYVGQPFADSHDFRKQIRYHSILEGRDVKFPINNKNKVQARCKHSTCPWVILGSQSKAEDTFRIKTFNEKHKCPRVQKVRAASAKLLGDVYKDKIYTDPKWPVGSMSLWVQKDLHVHVNKLQLYRAKNLVLKAGVVGDFDQYSLLWSYAEELRNNNPGTTVKIKCKPVGKVVRFKRFYICWGGLKRGFLEGCRPIMFLDGCHLKGAVGGMILSVVGIDGNNGIFPFAYAVVEKEKKKTWDWFLKLVLEDLGIDNYHYWTIMSDKQKGLIDAVEDLMPGVEHRFCVQHLYQNFKVHHKGLALKNLLWKAARASRVVDFNLAMGEVMAKDRAAFDWLVARPPCNWSRSHFSPYCKCDKLENNMSESFNAMILKARNQPIVRLLEAIRLNLMKRLYERRDKMDKYHGELSPIVDKLLEELKKKACEFIPHWNGVDQFEIEVVGGNKYKVHLGEKTCSCRRWQLTGIPCTHAISGINFMDWKVEDYVEHWYTKETFLKAYGNGNMLGTLDSQENWPQTDFPKMIPPKVVRMPGRPKLHGRKSQPSDNKKKHQKRKDGTIKLSRVGLSMKCSLCHKPDHNIRGCPLRPKPPADSEDGPGLDIPAATQDDIPVAKGNKVKRAKAPASRAKKGNKSGTSQKETGPHSLAIVQTESCDIPAEVCEYNTQERATQCGSSIVTPTPIVGTQQTIGSNSVVVNAPIRQTKSIRTVRATRKQKGKGQANVDEVHVVSVTETPTKVGNKRASIGESTPVRKTPPRAAKAKAVEAMQSKKVKDTVPTPSKKLKARRAHVNETQASQTENITAPTDYNPTSLIRPARLPGSSVITQEVRFSSTPSGSTHQTVIGTIKEGKDTTVPACTQM